MSGEDVGQHNEPHIGDHISTSQQSPQTLDSEKPSDVTPVTDDLIYQPARYLWQLVTINDIQHGQHYWCSKSW